VKAYHLDLEGMKGGKDRFESDALVQVLINAVLVQVKCYFTSPVRRLTRD
jgi:hypothetical protein